MLAAWCAGFASVPAILILFTTGATASADEGDLLLPASELSGTWVVYSDVQTAEGSVGTSVTYLDSLDYDAPLFVTISAAEFDNPSLAEAGTFRTATNEGKQGITVTPGTRIGDGKQYYGKIETSNGYVHTSYLFRVDNVGLFVRLSIPKQMNEDDRLPQLDDVAHAEEVWVRAQLSSGDSSQ
jgi:hypothetical protein